MCTQNERANSGSCLSTQWLQVFSLCGACCFSLEQSSSIWDGSLFGVFRDRMTLCVKAFVLSVLESLPCSNGEMTHRHMYRVKNAVSNRRFLMNVVICCEVLLLLLLPFWRKFYCHWCLIFWNLLELGFCQNNNISICTAFHETALWIFLCIKIDTNITSNSR